jgi:hypothetical protein
MMLSDGQWTLGADVPLVESGDGRSRYLGNDLMLVDAPTHGWQVTPLPVP